MTGEEMERAIDFLLKNQANFDARAEKTDQQIAQMGVRVEQLGVTVEQLIATVEQLSSTVEQLSSSVEQLSSTVEQMGARVDHQIAAVAETHTEFMQVMLRHVEAQGQINTDTRQTMRELAKAQQRTQQDISDLTKVVGNLIKFSSGNGNPPQE